MRCRLAKTRRPPPRRTARRTKKLRNEGLRGRETRRRHRSAGFVRGEREREKGKELRDPPQGALASRMANGSPFAMYITSSPTYPRCPPPFPPRSMGSGRSPPYPQRRVCWALRLSKLGMPLKDGRWPEDRQPFARAVRMEGEGRGEEHLVVLLSHLEAKLCVFSQARHNPSVACAGVSQGRAHERQRHAVLPLQTPRRTSGETDKIVERKRRRGHPV